MLARLPLESVYPEGGRLSRDAGRYQRADELIDDLRVLYDSLVAVGAWRVADDAVGPVDPGRADVRVSSGVARRPPEQPLPRSGDRAAAGGRRIRARRFSALERSRSGCDFLDRELGSPRPFLRADVSAGPEADAVLGTYRVLVEHLQALRPGRARRADRQHDAQRVRPAGRLPASLAKSA